MRKIAGLILLITILLAVILATVIKLRTTITLSLNEKVLFNGHELIYAGPNKSGKFFIILEGASKRLFSKNLKEIPIWGKLIRFLEITPETVKFSYQNLAEGNPPEAVKFRR